jgi:uncharacterized protein (DUF2345 family)
MMKQAQGFADTFNSAAVTHQTVQMLAAKGNKTLNQGKSESALDDNKAPLAAMLDKLSGQVSAQNGSTDDIGKEIPHSTAPIVTIAAQAGLGMTASDGLHIASGEAAHFASGRDTQIAVGEALTMHSGQAIGILAGAVSAGDGDTGIKLIAGKGDIYLQAQSSTMTFAAKDLVKFISANSHLDFAAAKSIELCTEQGASLKIEGGNITFACPGTLSIKASSKSFSGPTQMSYALPVMPSSQPALEKLKLNLKLSDMPGNHGTPLANRDWEIVQLKPSSIDQDETHTAALSLNPDNWETVHFKGTSQANGELGLTDEQQKKIWEIARKHSGMIWLVHGLQATPVSPSLWTSQAPHNQERIATALNHAPDSNQLDDIEKDLLNEHIKQDHQVSGIAAISSKVDY